MKTGIISSFNKEIKELKKLNNKNTNKDNYFVVEGYHLVQEALKSNLVEQIYETNEKAKYENSIKITQNVLNYVASTKTPEGIIALCKKPNNKSFGSKIVFLNNVQDPGNVGTIIRTAKAFGFDTIVSNINFYNNKIIRSTQGALFNINLINYKNDYEIVEKLKNEGYQIIISSLENDSKNFSSINYQKNNLAVIVGNEGNGVNKNLYELADHKVYIPIQFESLNVSVATGILLNEIVNNSKE